MTLREFVTGDLPNYDAKKPLGGDFYFVSCTLLVIGVVLGIAVTIYRRWSLLLNSSYSPAPLVLLSAVAVYLCWGWARITRQKKKFAEWASASPDDAKLQKLLKQAVIDLYKDFFLMCMLVLLLMMCLNMLIHPV